MRKISSVFQRGAAALVLGMAAGCATITTPSEEDNTSDTYNPKLDDIFVQALNNQDVDIPKAQVEQTPEDGEKTLAEEMKIDPANVEESGTPVAPLYMRIYPLLKLINDGKISPVKGQSRLATVCSVLRATEQEATKAAHFFTKQIDFPNADRGFTIATLAGIWKSSLGCARKPEPGDQTENDDDGYVVPIARTDKTGPMVG